MDNVLVVGGGPAGISAAVSLAQRGATVTLVEAGDRWGGHGRELCCQAVDDCLQCTVCLYPSYQRAVESTPAIHGLLNSRVTALEGHQGDFSARLSTGETVSAQAVILATGLQPFPAEQWPELGYDRHPNVMLSGELEKIFRQDSLPLTPKGDLPESLAFIQCVGSRDPARGRPWCSRICCAASLRLARLICQKIPACRVTIFYIDLQPAGPNFGQLVRDADNDGVVLVRSSVSKIYRDRRSQRLTLSHVSPEDGKQAFSEYDLAVLAIGIAHSSEGQELARSSGVALSPDGFIETGDAGGVRTSVPGLFAAGASVIPCSVAESVAQGALAAHAALQGLGGGK